MKYNDNFKFVKKSTLDKYGKSKQNNSPSEKYKRLREKEEKQKKNKFIEKISKIDSYWVKTLTDYEIDILYNLSKYQVYPMGIEEFVENKKIKYGNLSKTRDLKIEELMLD